MRSTRALAPHTLGVVVLLALTAGLAGCGGGSSAETPARSEQSGPRVDWLVPPRPIAGLSQRSVGHGPEAAVLLWAKGSPPPRDGVIFLHGWQPLPPHVYGEWLRHLAARGNTIVYPAYQERDTAPEDYLDNALAGIAAALRAVEVDPASLVAIGHKTGGALAFDYAAAARSAGLPAPRGVLAVRPGRDPPTGEVAPADLSRIPPRTLLATITGPGNPLPDGDAQARRLLGAATRVPPARRSYLRSSNRDRYGPLDSDRAARRSFWAPADRLIAAARGDRRLAP